MKQKGNLTWRRKGNVTLSRNVTGYGVERSLDKEQKAGLTWSRKVT
jgi:hypothetical protein